MSTLTEWAKRHPEAAADLDAMFQALPWPQPAEAGGKSEAWAQQQTRLAVADQGGMTWRNNNGAVPAKCPNCGVPRAPTRYGLANDSPQLNARIKSSDLIGIIPRRITQGMVGDTIGQFLSIECKRQGWAKPTDERERAQLEWLRLVRRMGGYAEFSTGEVQL